MNNCASLATKYRPEDLDGIIGQDSITKSLKTLLAQKEIPKAYLFIGGPGVGKTSLARIIAKKVGCEENNILELDAATYGGVDIIRELTDGLRYGGIGKTTTKFVIIDEAQMASKAAFSALLKILEEPPSHVFFAFCTTEGNKIPEAIKTRCHTFNLKEVRSSEIAELLDKVCKLEDIKLPDRGTDVIAKESKGSPRRALTYLSQCRGCVELKEIQKIIESCSEETFVEELAKLIAFPKTDSWEKVTQTFSALKKSDEVINPEGMRVQIVNYLMACLLSAKDPKKSLEFLDKLANFLKPINSSSTGLAELLVSIAAAIL